LLALTLTIGLGACSTTPVRTGPDPLSRNPALLANLYVFGSAEYAVVTRTLYGDATTAVRARMEALRRNQPVRQAVHAAGDTTAFPACTPRQRQRPAVILDIDETVLLNIGYQGFALRNGGYSPATWSAWEAAGSPNARPVPGVEAFLASLIQQGVEPIFLSNRSVANAEPTKAALIEILSWTQAGYQPAERIIPGQTLLLRADDRDKTARRVQAATERCILAVVGDQLGDFSQSFDSDSTGAAVAPDARASLTERVSGQWGQAWFLLPNPGYGHWTEGLNPDRVLGSWAPPKPQP
jgi:5'-nucleotidase (lipoprotein e(P4) family)